MSQAWETTTDDVAIVLSRHGIAKTETELQSIFDSLDTDIIEDALLEFTSMDAQTDSMLSNVEDQLMENGIIPKGNKKCVMEDDYDEDEEE